MKFFVADLPARRIRSRIPKLKDGYERTKANSEERLAREQAQLGREALRYQKQKEQCQSILKGL
jgi:hypothetical protein